MAGVGWLAVDLDSANYFTFRSAPSSKKKAMKAMKVSKKPAVAPPASKQDKKTLLQALRGSRRPSLDPGPRGLDLRTGDLGALGLLIEAWGLGA